MHEKYQFIHNFCPLFSFKKSLKTGDELISSILERSLKYCWILFLLYSAIMFFFVVTRVLTSAKKLQEGGYLIYGNLLISCWIRKYIPAGVHWTLCTSSKPSMFGSLVIFEWYTKCKAFYFTNNLSLSSAGWLWYAIHFYLTMNCKVKAVPSSYFSSSNLLNYSRW